MRLAPPPLGFHAGYFTFESILDRETETMTSRVSPLDPTRLLKSEERLMPLGRARSNTLSRPIISSLADLSPPLRIAFGQLIFGKARLIDFGGGDMPCLELSTCHIRFRLVKWCTRTRRSLMGPTFSHWKLDPVRPSTIKRLVKTGVNRC